MRYRDYEEDPVDSDKVYSAGFRSGMHIGAAMTAGVIAIVILLSVAIWATAG